MRRIFLSTLLFIFLSHSAAINAAVILQYHHISEDTPPATSTKPEQFEAHLRYLKDNDFSVIPLPELIEKLRAGKTLPDKAVAITFDDAYRSVYDTAFPLLKKYKFPFTFFVNSAPIESGHSEFVNWKNIAEMSAAGATIANHTRNHAHMVRYQENETQAQWSARMSQELIENETLIKKHSGQSHRFLAYPYGEYDSKVLRLLKDLDYIGFGQQSGAVGIHTDWHAIPRFPMGGIYASMKNFPTKAASLAMPIKGIQLENAKGKILTEAVLKEGDRPVLEIQFQDKFRSDNIQCYLNGDEITVERFTSSIRVQSNKNLNAGRSRYNCTSRDDSSGRYYWYSQAWLLTDKQGNWVHEPD